MRESKCLVASLIPETCREVVIKFSLELFEVPLSVAVMNRNSKRWVEDSECRIYVLFKLIPTNSALIMLDKLK